MPRIRYFAVVAAGLVHSIERERLESSSRLRVVSDSTWSVILYVLNGLVFILLGLEIPEVVTAVWEDPAYNNARAIGYIFIITSLLLLIRFAWVWLTNRHSRSALLMTLSGVRGALTLAAAFSIPAVFADGRPFPERSLMLYICAGVILLTLVSASVFLPLLTRSAKKTVGHSQEVRGLNEREARIRVLEAGIRTIREEMSEENKREAVDMISEYNRRLQRTRLEGRVDYRKEWRTAVGVRLEAMKAEREVASYLQREGKITAAMESRLLTALSQMELILSKRMILKRTAILAWFAAKRLLMGKDRASRISRIIRIGRFLRKSGSLVSGGDRTSETDGVGAGPRSRHCPHRTGRLQGNGAAAAARLVQGFGQGREGRAERGAGAEGDSSGEE